MSLSLIVVGKSYAECAEFYARNEKEALPVDEMILLDNRRARFGGLGRIWETTPTRGTTVGMVHADTVLSAEFLDRVLIETEVHSAVAGIVGRSLQSFYIWSKEQDKTERVSTLDGCSVFAAKETLIHRDLHFDAVTFDSFHCCVEDFCLSATQAGVPIVVPPGRAEHEGKSTQDQKWLREYWVYRRRLEEKYPNTVFLTT